MRMDSSGHRFNGIRIDPFSIIVLSSNEAAMMGLVSGAFSCQFGIVIESLSEYESELLNEFL